MDLPRSWPVESPARALRPAALAVGVLIAATTACASSGNRSPGASSTSPSTRTPGTSATARPAPSYRTDIGAPALLASLPIKGRAPKTGYSRKAFGQTWADVDRNGCDTRNDILNRDLTDKTWRAGTRNCVVLGGKLADPYTGRVISFAKTDAAAVQIDHIVALSDAWQTGAQSWDVRMRERFANDPTNLFAVDGEANQAKGDSDAASWLPPDKTFRCRYVWRQIQVKAAYGLWVTAAEHDAMASALRSCPAVDAGG
jgi:hypothetical protein